jgi:hypothetical protein
VKRVVSALGSRTVRSRSGARGALALALLVAGLGLGGCSISMSDMPMLGSSDPAEKPKDAPRDANGYPAVNDLPRSRDEAVLAPAERNKIEQELIAARERQAAANANASAAAGGAGAAASPAASR